MSANGRTSLRAGGEPGIFRGAPGSGSVSCVHLFPRCPPRPPCRGWALGQADTPQCLSTVRVKFSQARAGTGIEVSVLFLFFLLASGLLQGDLPFVRDEAASIALLPDTRVCIPPRLKICQRGKASDLSPQIKIRCLISNRSERSAADAVPS